MNILFTICGRAGSKGIKNKNVKEFLGYPLPFYTASVIDLYIKNNLEISNSVVALNTDSFELKELFNNKINMNVEIVDREISLAQDNTPKIQVIKNTYEIVKQRLNMEFDLIVDLDITSPLRTVEDLSNVITKKVNTESDVVFSVTTSRRNPYFNMVQQTNKGYTRILETKYNTRQEAPEIFDMNASLYAYSPQFLLSDKNIFEGSCEIIKMMDTAVLDLDDEQDFELMQVIADYLFKNYDEMNAVYTHIENIIHIKN